MEAQPSCRPRPFLQRILKASPFPLVVQGGLLLVFGLIIVGGWGITTDDPAFAKTLRNTNLANLLVWSYWWPIIIIAAVVLGRAWCMVCPMELVATLCSRIGLRRRAPKWLQGGWVITLFYAAILLFGIHTWAVHRIPARMALYMLLLLAAAVVCGLIFEKRAFCSYVCPVGYLLGLYAMVSPLRWTVRDKTTCDTCTGKDCVAKQRRHRLIGRSCTSGLYPATLSDNRQCLLCTQCLKACPYDNPTLVIQKPFADFFRPVRLSGAQTAFVFLVAAFIVYEILSEWDTSKAVLLWGPNRVLAGRSLSTEVYGLARAVILFLLYPAVFFGIGALVVSRLGRIPWARAASRLALLLLPVMAAIHLLKALIKMVSRIPYWAHVFRDPAGVQTAERIMQNGSVLDKTLANALGPAVTAAAVILLLVALGAVLAITRKSPALDDVSTRGRWALALVTLLYWGLFAVTIVAWRF